MSLESGRKLGFIASIIAVIMPIVAFAGLASFIFGAIATASRGAIPSIGTGVAFTIGIIAFGIAVIVMAVLGFIMFVVAMYRLSNYYKEPAIFKNVLYAILVGLISIVVVIVVVSLFFVFTLGSITQVPGTGVTPPTATFFGAYIGIWGASLAMGIVSAFFVYRAFNKLGEKSGVDSFKTAGLLYLIGTAVPFFGSIIAWIGWIFAAISFNKLKPITPISYQTPFVQPPLQTKRWPYCSTENTLDANYCRFCGKPLQ